MQTWKRRVLLIGAGLWLSGCAGLPGSDAPREVIFSAERVGELLAGKLGFSRKLLDVLDVQVGQPKVSFDEAAKRMRAGLDVSVRHPFSSRPLTGRAVLSGGLSFDERTLTLLLLEPKIESLDMDGVPSALRDTLSRLGNVVGGELLRQYPIATLKPEDLRAGGRDWRVTGLEIVGNALKVLVAPKP